MEALTKRHSRWFYRICLVAILAMSTACIITGEDENQASGDHDGDGDGDGGDGDGGDGDGGDGDGGDGDLDDPDTPGNCTDLHVLAADDLNGGVTISENTCYRINNRLTIDDGVLTIEPGVELVFGQDAGLNITGGGRLKAEGTDSNQIRFTGAEPQRGFWAGITYSQTRSNDNILDNVIIEYAGSRTWSGGARSQAGIYINGDGVQLTIRDSTLRGHSVSAITTDGSATDLILEGNHFVDNHLPLSLEPRHIGSMAADNTFEDNTNSYVQVRSSDLDEDQTWPVLSVPFEVGSRNVVGATLTLNAGTEFIFRQDAGLNFSGDGRLNADASGGDPIRFQGTEEISGFWAGISFDNSLSPNNVLNNVLIENGGSRGWAGGERSQAGLRLARASLVDVTDTTITGSGKYGVSVENDSQLTGCSGLQVSDSADEDFFLQSGGPEGDTHVCDGNFGS